MGAVTTITSRRFNQDLSAAKRAAEEGPVIITDRGKPAWVLMRHDAWKHLQGQGRSLREALDLPGVEAVAFDPPRLGEIARPAPLD
ncbi:MAG: type II toxin-antitoxin system prevent-host-death family antitoxin [Betaproteobacteria bacterium]|nr:type II toxin-antitoxin system prevent-host-death family antitoxin [Betaproteobacteria bacterium]